MTRVEASRCVAVLLAAFPHARTTSQTATVYEEALLDLDLEHVDAAVRALILTELDFIPSIAKIRASAILRRDGRGRPAGEAWGIVRRAVGMFGRDKETDVLAAFAHGMRSRDQSRWAIGRDPIAARAIKGLGWRDLCDSEESDLPSYRARFIQLYEQLADDDTHDRATAGILPPPPTRDSMALSGAIGDVMKQLITNARDEETPPWER